MIYHLFIVHTGDWWLVTTTPDSTPENFAFRTVDGKVAFPAISAKLFIKAIKIEEGSDHKSFVINADSDGDAKRQAKEILKSQ